MNRFSSTPLALLIALIPATLLAQGHPPNDNAPYAGFEKREIKSLSETDIDDLRRGAGWGLALSAELNGVPGPAHLLELADQIPLDTEQVVAVQALYDGMKREAIAVGARLIAAEAAIEEAFRGKNLSTDQLRFLIADAETARAELRYIHLSQHLSTPPLLTTQQIDRYKVLRGYGSDPCAVVPSGHDPAKWLRHNNCG